MPSSSSGDSSASSGPAARKEAEARSSPSASPPNLAASLHEAALDYLARYAASSARLRRVLERRVRRRRTDRDGLEAARGIIGDIVAKLTAQGFLEDGRYAAARAESLSRQGRSRRWIEARLAADGIAPDLIRGALEALGGNHGDRELEAAIAFAKRRRLGPYRRTRPRSPGALQALADKERAAFARAGFDRRTAQTVLGAASPDALAALLATG
ncbi:hypothetical protein FRZ61_06050 [Hypericibacter adhaerens]|uniref:Regulatory protein RecX n=1 Tax=Hypericibacter adhaerens TaxID=2602016 RepID=A0A5J6N1A6_9PROT|nr:RecX family transcriptional regulator [Hypericibacter adhaerens]QEX20686.1 hypothetical protein FRZ61_06050 [Hypericibacter adhaerens]